MHELNQFCQKYLPRHFASKYQECDKKEHFFNYNNEGSVYEMTGKNFALLEKLLAANPGLEASKIIEKYFIFTIMEFKKYRDQVKEGAEEKEVQCRTREAIRQVLKTMVERDRMCFQIFVRLAFFYFLTRENELMFKKNKPSKKVEQKHFNFYDEIIAFFMDMKFLSMTEDDSFNSSAFMEHCLRILLNLNPNPEFFAFVNKVMDECVMGEAFQERVKEKIEAIKTKKLGESLKMQKKMTPLKMESSNSESSILEPKNQNIPPSNLKSIQQTPVKARSTSKSERKTHETSQKKEYIDNKKEQEPNTLNALKRNLQLQKNRPIKQRTIYSRKTYLMPKKNTTTDQTSSAGSNQNNNNQELFLLDFNRSYSSRYFDFQNEDEEDDGFLVGATPKPKKKVKIEKNDTDRFDGNGNFVRGFNQRNT